MILCVSAALLVYGAGALCLPGPHMEPDIERQAVYISRLNHSTLLISFIVYLQFHFYFHFFPLFAFLMTHGELAGLNQILEFNILEG